MAAEAVSTHSMQVEEAWNLSERMTREFVLDILDENTPRGLWI